jgi:hypothetical protein
VSLSKDIEGLFGIALTLISRTITIDNIKTTVVIVRVKNIVLVLPELSTVTTPTATVSTRIAIFGVHFP